MPKMPITDVVSIYKMQRTGSQEAPGAAPTYTSVNATISPTGQHIQTSEGSVASYQLYEIFVWDSTIQLNNGDRVKSGGTTYLVTSSPNFYNNQFIQATSAMAYVVM